MGKIFIHISRRYNTKFPLIYGIAQYVHLLLQPSAILIYEYCSPVVITLFIKFKSVSTNFTFFATGRKELILIAQDTSKYGKDIYGEPKLAELLTELCKIKDLKWVRFLYTFFFRNFLL